MMTLHTSLILALALTLCLRTARADDLDQLADPTITGDERGQVYARLKEVPFPPIAARLLTAIDSHPVHACKVRPTKPWSDANLSEGDRIACTLQKLWEAQLARAKTPGQNIEVLLNLIDDTSLGKVRGLPVNDVFVCLGATRRSPDPAMPPLEMILKRLERPAFDSKEPADLRAHIVRILYKHGDPNRYLDLALQISSTGQTLDEQVSLLVYSACLNQSQRLSTENRAKYVQRCGALLERTGFEDTALAWVMASQFGDFLGIPPERPGLGAFVPDYNKPEYKNGAKRWDEDTIKNARAWWAKHKLEYAEPAPK